MVSKRANFIMSATNNSEWEQLAGRQLEFLSGQYADYPAGHSMFLLALLLHENYGCITVGGGKGRT